MLEAASGAGDNFIKAGIFPGRAADGLSGLFADAAQFWAVRKAAFIGWQGCWSVHDLILNRLLSN
jgi:hypothetical protein